MSSIRNLAIRMDRAASSKGGGDISTMGWGWLAQLPYIPRARRGEARVHSARMNSRLPRVVLTAMLVSASALPAGCLHPPAPQVASNYRPGPGGKPLQELQ